MDKTQNTKKYQLIISNTQNFEGDIFVHRIGFFEKML
jgi:hypothetical protein